MGSFFSREQPAAAETVNEHVFQDTPHGKMMYGANGLACAVMFGRLDADVHEHLLNSTEAFNCAESKMLELGFFKCVDYPQLPKHVYYEGYFHSCRTNQAIPSINPRTGRQFDKPAAPKAVRALYVAFREKNRDKFLAISKQILNTPINAPTTPQTETDPMKDLKFFADLFNPEGDFAEVLCGDLAIQVHCGTGVTFENVGWHRDAVNSLFHFAASIRGKRALYSYISEFEEPSKSEQEPTVDQLSAPDIYISSPYFFRHGVEYPQQGWQDRTIAIQARFLLTRNVLLLLSQMTSEVKSEIATIVANSLIEGFELPTLREVLEVEETLD